MEERIAALEAKINLLSLAGIASSRAGLGVCEKIDELVKKVDQLEARLARLAEHTPHSAQ